MYTEHMVFQNWMSDKVQDVGMSHLFRDGIVFIIFFIMRQHGERQRNHVRMSKWSAFPKFTYELIEYNKLVIAFQY